MLSIRTLFFGQLCFYRVITDIWDIDYNMFKIPVFKCDWVDNKSGIKIDEFRFTLVEFNKLSHKSDPFILASQAKQVFYVQYQLDPIWSIVRSPSQKYFMEKESVDNLTNDCMEHHPFINALPNVETFDEMDDSDAKCMQTDCDGIWIETKSSV